MRAQTRAVVGHVGLLITSGSSPNRCITDPPSSPAISSPNLGGFALHLGGFALHRNLGSFALQLGGFALHREASPSIARHVSPAMGRGSGAPRSVGAQAPQALDYGRLEPGQASAVTGDCVRCSHGLSW